MMRIEEWRAGGRVGGMAREGVERGAAGGRVVKERGRLLGGKGISRTKGALVRFRDLGRGGMV